MVGKPFLPKLKFECRKRRCLAREVRPLESKLIFRKISLDEFSNETTCVLLRRHSWRAPHQASLTRRKRNAKAARKTHEALAQDLKPPIFIISLIIPNLAQADCEYLFRLTLER